MGFHSIIKKRLWAYVLMLSLAALQIYLTLAIQQQARVGTLHSGNYSVIRTMERTFDNALPQKNGERFRLRAFAFMDTLSATKIVCERVGAELFFTSILSFHAPWDILIDCAFTAEPGSALVLRI